MSGVATFILYCWLQYVHDAVVAVVIGIAAGLTVMFVVFLVNLARSKTLDDPPRTLSRKKQKKISDYLNKQKVRRFCWINVCEGVKDGKELPRAFATRSSKLSGKATSVKLAVTKSILREFGLLATGLSLEVSLLR